MFKSRTFLAVMGAIALILSFFAASPANATSGGCKGRNVPSNIRVNEVDTVTDGSPNNTKFVLRYSPDTGCFWGLVHTDAVGITGYIWLERWEGSKGWKQVTRTQMTGIGKRITHTSMVSGFDGTHRACGKSVIRDYIVGVRDVPDNYEGPTTCTGGGASV